MPGLSEKISLESPDSRAPSSCAIIPRKLATTILPKAASVSSEFSSAGRFTIRMRRFSTTSRMSTSPLSTLKMWPRLTASCVKVAVK